MPVRRAPVGRSPEADQTAGASPKLGNLAQLKAETPPNFRPFELWDATT